MKQNRQTHHRIGLFRAGIPVLLLGIMLVSCQDKLHEAYQPTDGLLRFVVNDSVQWQQGQIASSESRFEEDTSFSPQAIKVNGTVEEGRQMYLIASVKEGIDATNSAFGKSSEVATKGTMITGNDAATFHQSFGILAQSYSSTAPAEFTPNFMDRVQVSRTGDTYSAANKYYIPTGQTVKMFAYAPYDATTLAESPTGSTTLDGGLVIAAQSNGRPSYTYRTPKWLADQDDLCFAENLSVTRSNAQATLTFGHAMAAVRFLVSSTVEDCEIKSISLNNIYSKATLTPTTQSGQGWWSYPNPAVTANFTYNNGGNEITHSTGTATDIFGEGKAMFMIPHTLSEASVTIAVRVGSSDMTLTAPLTGTWTKGNTYTYTLSFSTATDFTFTVQPTTGSYNDGVVTQTSPGDAFNFSILSKTENDTRLGYKIEYTTDDGASWLEFGRNSIQNDITNNGSSEVTWENYNYTHSFTATELFTVKSTKNDELQALDPTTTKDSPSNLSAANGTANCYIVNRAGWYTFPMVYGNAMDGNLNEKDNFRTNKGSYQNAYGASITNAWIAYDIMSPTGAPSMVTLTARVLWQDVQGLVSNVEVIAGGMSSTGTLYRRVRFNVAKSTIEEGNAVIGAFTPDGVCVWSWHIWVTPSSTTANTAQITGVYDDGGSSTTRKFLTSPIGTVHEGDIIWTARSVKIRFVPQNPDNANAFLTSSAQEFTLTTVSQTKTYPGRYVTYQWGRKDPMLPMTIQFGASTDGRNSPVYPGEGGNTGYLPPNVSSNYVSTNFVHPNNDSENFLLPTQMIRNPHMFYAVTSSFGYLKVQANWWNARHGKNTVVDTRYEVALKSIYDPSPPGYVVPPARAFEDFARYSDGTYPSGFTKPTSNSSGGYGTGMDKKSSGAGYIIFWLNNGEFRLPLLGIRATQKFMAPTVYNKIGAAWTTGAFQAGNSHTQYGNCVAAKDGYLDILGARSVDDYGIFDGINVAYTENALPVIPCQEQN